MLQLTNYSKLPSIIFNSVELTANEKIMLAYLTNRSNYFKREEDWFGVPLCDFGSDIGFTDHHKVSDVRNALKEKGLIDYRRGGQKKATQYKVNWQNIESCLSSRYDSQNKNVWMMDRAFGDTTKQKNTLKLEDLEETLEEYGGDWDADIPIPYNTPTQTENKQKKVINFPQIPNGESVKFASERFTQILQNNFVGDKRFATDKAYQNEAVQYISKYLGERYGVPEQTIRNEIETYKNNFIKNTTNNNKPLTEANKTERVFKTNKSI